MKNDDHNYEVCTRAFGALALAHAVVSAQLEKALRNEVGLGINEFDVLVGLDGKPDRSLPLSALTEITRLSQPAISRLVDRLEQRGLIVRQGGAVDRRAVIVRITDKGAALLQRAIPIHSRCIQENSGPLDSRGAQRPAVGSVEDRG
jgi:DNA-binding MarR family transcriptional regulator